VSEAMIGAPVPRVDGPAKVTGAARYAAEFDLPTQAYAIIVTSTIGRGRVVAIETEAVARLPGVLEVLTHLNAPRLPYAPYRSYVDPETGERLHVLQDDEVRFFGQPVAVVIASTIEDAEHAAAALRIRYDARPPLVHIDAPDAAPVPPAGKDPPSDTRRGDPAATVRPAVTIDSMYRIARENHNPMEPHATIAAWDGDQLTVWSKSQFVASEAKELAAILGLPATAVHVVCPYVGGAFGSSLRTWPHVTLAAIAARHVGRPVKLVLSRRQMYNSTGHRPYTVQRVVLSAERDGRLLGIMHEGSTETSRYEEFTESLTEPSTYMYSCPHVRTRYRIVPVDQSTPTYMRAPGAASGFFALETAMDELAVALAIDPIELRLRNEPTVNESDGRPFSSRSLRACYTQAADHFGWAKRNPVPGSMRDGRLRIGWGMAAAAYHAVQGRAQARARLLRDGEAVIETAASDMGPGTYTSLTQVAADALCLPLASIRLQIGSSDFPPTPPHGGSMTMASVGSAVRAACLALRAEISKHALAGESYRETIVRRGGQPIEVVASSAPSEERRQFSMYAFGAVFVEVAVDPDLGMIRVRRIVGAYGAGRIVNPRLARSQCLGGMVGGIGMALMEQTLLDSRDGRPVNTSMADYLVPVNLDVGTLEALFVEEEDPHVNPLGVKGIGEIAIVGVAPAIANAVFHATGRRVRDLPIRLEALL
jgi:xanthine dehydrogenase YagR molybdenum-binding subunit